MHFCLFFEGFGEYLFSSLVYVVFCGNMLSVKYIIVLCSNVEEGNPVQLRVKPVVTKNGGGASPQVSQVDTGNSRMQSIIRVCERVL